MPKSNRRANQIKKERNRQAQLAAYEQLLTASAGPQVVTDRWVGPREGSDEYLESNFVGPPTMDERMGDYFYGGEMSSEEQTDMEVLGGDIRRRDMLDRALIEEDERGSLHDFGDGQWKYIPRHGKYKGRIVAVPQGMSDALRIMGDKMQADYVPPYSDLEKP